MYERLALNVKVESDSTLTLNASRSYNFIYASKASQMLLRNLRKIYATVEIHLKGDSRFARGIREICENRSVPRHFLTILAEFVLFISLRTNFGACNKLTTGLTLDSTSLLLREYKI